MLMGGTHRGTQPGWAFIRFLSYKLTTMRIVVATLWVFGVEMSYKEPPYIGSFLLYDWTKSRWLHIRYAHCREALTVVPFYALMKEGKSVKISAKVESKGLTPGKKGFSMNRKVFYHSSPRFLLKICIVRWTRTFRRVVCGSNTLFPRKGMLEEWEFWGGRVGWKASLFCDGIDWDWRRLPPFFALFQLVNFLFSKWCHNIARLMR